MLLDVLPDKIQQEIDAISIRQGTLKVPLFCAQSDKKRDGQFGVTWIVGFESELHLYDAELKCIQIYPYANLSGITIEFYVSGGAITYKHQEEYEFLIEFSGALIPKFNQVIKLIEKLQKGETIGQEDINDDNLPKFCPKCQRMYPDNNTLVCPKCIDKKSLFVRLLGYFTNYKGEVAIMFFLMLVSAGLNVVRPYLQGTILFDEVLDQNGKYVGKLLPVIGIILLVHFVSVLCQILQGRINSRITGEMIFDLKKDVFSAMQGLSMSFYTKKQTGSLMTRVTGDATHIQYFFHDGMPYLLVNSVVLIGVVVMMIKTQWQLSLLVFIPIPLIILMVVRVFPKFHKLYHKRYRATSKMNNVINDALTGIRVVKAFGKEADEMKRFSRLNEQASDVENQVGVFGGTVMPIMYFIMSIGGLVVWGLGGWMVIQDKISFGTIITFTGYLGIVYQPLQFMTEIVGWWSDCMNSAKRIFDILDSKPDIVEAINAKQLPDIQGDIEISNVTFGYEIHKPVLKNITLSIKAGEMIGLVGHSGAGKSTITNLITRLYDVDEGYIKIDGTDVKAVNLCDLHRQVGMVLQETFLFSGTIAENIAYAREDASIVDIIEAAKAANAHDFIVELDDGYDTLIGQKGQDLSGGQKQRISIARAILQNPKILVLDEATASVDTETEQKIQVALEHLIKGRTTIAIAHRLSTLRNADKLVVVEHGVIVEQGSHEVLFELKGKYYDMIMEQKKALKYQGVDF